MRILHVVPTYFPVRRHGGPLESVHQLARYSAKLGHDVHVFTTNVDGPTNLKVSLNESVNHEGVKIHYFSCPILRVFYYSPSMKEELSKHIRDFDLLHIHSLYRWPTWMAARMAKGAGIPYILSPRGMLIKHLIRKKKFLAKSIWIQLIEKQTIEEAAAIHATSNLEEQEIRKFKFMLPPIFMIPNGISEESVEETVPGTEQIRKILGGKPYLLYLGRIHWKKGLDQLIRAMVYMPGVQLMIAGNDEDSYQPVLEQLATKNNVRDRIAFIGPVYAPEKFSLMRNARAFALLSYSENFGNAVLEAMAVGCPVLVTPEVGLAETVQNSGAGMVVEGDPEKLGKSIAGLLRDTERLRKMGEAGKKTALNQFSYSLIAKNMEQVYKKIVHTNLVSETTKAL